jgi:hypothetical protein
MGRFNKETGEFKPKPSIQRSSDWMQQRPLPIRSVARNKKVKVRTGGGWESGSVIRWSKDGLTVWLGRSQRQVTVRDNRNFKTEEDPK